MTLTEVVMFGAAVVAIVCLAFFLIGFGFPVLAKIAEAGESLAERILGR